MKELLLIIVILLAGSCASNYRLKRSDTTEDEIKISKKTQQQYYSIKNSNLLTRDVDQRSKHNISLQCSLDNFFAENITVKFFRRLTKVESLKFKDKTESEEILFAVNEVIESESILSKVLRVVTLGLYPQRIKKKVSLIVSRGNERVSREYESSANLYAPLNIIPFNLNDSKYLIRKEHEKYTEEFYEILKFD